MNGDLGSSSGGMGGRSSQRPAERMKMRRPHAVPLSRQVLAYLAGLHPLTGPDEYVLPTLHTSRRPLSENTVNQVFRRLGYAAGEVTANDLRATASTLLNESGMWSADAIKRSLAHVDKELCPASIIAVPIGRSVSPCISGGTTLDTLRATVTDVASAKRSRA